MLAPLAGEKIMDVSHFGLFDLTSHQPRWTGQPGNAAEGRVVPIGAVRRGIANDNVEHDAPRTRRAKSARRLRHYKSLMKLVLHRGTEPGQA